MCLNFLLAYFPSVSWLWSQHCTVNWTLASSIKACRFPQNQLLTVMLAQMMLKETCSSWNLDFCLFFFLNITIVCLSSLLLFLFQLVTKLNCLQSDCFIMGCNKQLFLCFFLNRFVSKLSCLHPCSRSPMISELFVLCNNIGLGFWNVNSCLRSCVRYGDVPFLRNTLIRSRGPHNTCKQLWGPVLL